MGLCEVRFQQLPYRLCMWQDTRGRANMANVRQSRPDSGLGFQVKVFKPI